MDNYPYKRSDPKRARVIVEFDRHPNISMADAIEYITDAVRCYGGSMHPDDPQFNHFRNAVAHRCRAVAPIKAKSA